MSEYDFDLFTIGAGSGGVAASRRAGARGAKVGLCEERRVGGTCVLRGCVPKKLLVYAASFADEMEDASGFGWTIGPREHDWGRLISAKDTELERLESIYRRLLRDSGVVVHQGRGEVVDAHTVRVGSQNFSAAHILIASGGAPMLPDVPGIEHAITSEGALDLGKRPDRVAIVGGGYIGVEFAGVFNALGSDVHMFLRGDNVLRGFDFEVRERLGEEMQKRGVHIETECRVHSIEPRRDGALSLLLNNEETLEVDQVLYATGRLPATAGMGLEGAGIELDERGAIVVDEFSRTNVPSVYAVGDVTDRINLTPVAIAEARALVATLFENRPTPVSHLGVASAVFSHPPVGTVGLAEQTAREQGYEVDVYASHFRPMKATLSGRDERTFVKLVVDRTSDRVLGVHMVGPDAPEIVQGFSVALNCGATKAQFDATVGIHPTAAEELVTLRTPRPDART